MPCVSEAVSKDKMKTSQPNNLLFFAARPVLPFGVLEGLGRAAKHDLALFFSSLLLRQPRQNRKLEKK
ncbi:MAG: hypothetical protein KDD02_22275, partial [Phaeodactylibacter sp.]|nr:hypothetical protein [Phaeodactylibacter sp.]